MNKQPELTEEQLEIIDAFKATFDEVDDPRVLYAAGEYAQRRSRKLKSEARKKQLRADWNRKWKGITTKHSLRCKSELRVESMNLERMSFSNAVHFKVGEVCKVYAVQPRKRMIWVYKENSQYTDAWPLTQRDLDAHFQEA